MKTLGERLDLAGRRLAARHVTSFPWESALLPALNRAAALDAPLAGRFDRVEPDLAHQDHADARDAAPLSPEVRGRIRDLAGPGADTLRPHVGGAADALARRHRADAVTLGADVYFRDDRFHPEEPAGLGLIAHEAAHVTDWLSSPRPAPYGTGPSGRAAPPEIASPESPAERAFTSWPGPAPPGWPPPGARQDGPSEAGQPPYTPGPPATASHGADDHALAVENATRLAGTAGPGFVIGPAVPDVPAGPVPRPPGPQAGPAPMAAGVGRDLATPPPPVDLEQLRHDLVSDLMRQLRSEFERGG
ncbi:hypothetical protein Acor_55400 [Acrocarpospora corrugata]|uniref:eCIS core domain-containing protein n=1 Tax=Acrocarpospora corrugata TaxID=35763 RepID=A0A5M3W3X0_9ACTN|nr:DUF4157 domain-containing protein [Acrocarpospora corrugata]GES03474.1 hypothetical protein Acor_55400 [Acrocarpospora corrugata]